MIISHEIVFEVHSNLYDHDTATTVTMKSNLRPQLVHYTGLHYTGRYK